MRLMTDPWKDKRSFIQVETGADNSLIYKGVLHYNGVDYRFSLRQQTVGPYLMRGRIAALSPADGKVMVLRGKLRRDVLQTLETQQITGVAAEKHERLKIVREIHANSKEQAEIKEIALNAAKEITMEHGISIQAELGIPAGENLYAFQVLIRCQNQYLASRKKLTASTKKKYGKMLQEVFSHLSDCPTRDITVRNLEKCYEKLGEGAAEKFRLAQRFWSYCLECGTIHGANPFDLFWDQYKIKIKRDANGKKTARLAKKAVTPTSLPAEVERASRRAIMQAAADDGLMTGILLIQEAGLSTQMVYALKWADIIFLPQREEFVLIRVVINGAAASTHDYTAPCTPFLARELRRRYLALKASVPENTLQNQYLLTNRNGEHLADKRLTAYCRQHLMHMGMDTNYLVPDAGEVYGVGVSLLQKNFLHKAAYICGLSTDTGALKFLRKQSLRGDVTSDCYRDLAKTDGQEFLFGVLRRDGRFESLPNRREIERVNASDGDTITTIPPQNMDRPTAVSACFLLQPGEVLQITTHYGLCGGASAKADQQRSPRRD